MENILHIAYNIGNGIFNFTAVTTAVLLGLSYIALSQTMKDIKYKNVSNDDINALIGIKFIIGISFIMFALVLWRYFW